MNRSAKIGLNFMRVRYAKSGRESLLLEVAELTQAFADLLAHASRVGASTARKLGDLVQAGGEIGSNLGVLGEDVALESAVRDTVVDRAKNADLSNFILKRELPS